MLDMGMRLGAEVLQSRETYGGRGGLKGPTRRGGARRLPKPETTGRPARLTPLSSLTLARVWPCDSRSTLCCPDKAPVSDRTRTAADKAGPLGQANIEHRVCESQKGGDEGTAGFFTMRIIVAVWLGSITDQ